VSVSSDSANPVLLSSTNKAAATMASGHPDNSPVPNRLSYLSNFAAEVANSWLLPDGVADVLFDDAQKQEVLRPSSLSNLSPMVISWFVHQ